MDQNLPVTPPDDPIADPDLPTPPTVPEPQPQPPDMPDPYPVSDPIPGEPTPQPVQDPQHVGIVISQSPSGGQAPAKTNITITVGM